MANQVSTVNQELSVEEEVSRLVKKIDRYLVSGHSCVPHVFEATSEEVAKKVAQIKKDDHWIVEVIPGEGKYEIKLNYPPHTR